MLTMSSFLFSTCSCGNVSLLLAVITVVTTASTDPAEIVTWTRQRSLHYIPGKVWVTDYE